MNITKKLILPISLASVFVVTSQLAAADTSVKQESKEVLQEVKKDSKEAWTDVKHTTKKAWNNTQDAYQEGIIAGKIETAIILNPHLNPFEIGFDVEGNHVVLTGKVGTDIEKDLAENIVKGVDGVEKVNNNIVVDKTTSRSGNNLSKDGTRSFSQYVEDATTTASIKTELIANDNIKGLDINVDTFNDTVTLRGEVKSQSQKSLAEAIVKKRDGVTDVVNQLKVKS